MLKLYRLNDAEKLYWETWDEGPDTHVLHWGELGTQGSSRTLTSTPSRNARIEIQQEINDLVASGFAPVAPESHATLLVEYAVDGMGSAEDLAKRHELEGRMNELLGWTGLGHCDGGSIGSGAMEVCNLVIDADLARRVIANDLKGTRFADYTRIYEEPKD